MHAINRRLAEARPDSFPKQGFTTRLRNYMDVTVASGEMRTSLRRAGYGHARRTGFVIAGNRGIRCQREAERGCARSDRVQRELGLHTVNSGCAHLFAEVRGGQERIQRARE